MNKGVELWIIWNLINFSCPYKTNWVFYIYLHITTFALALLDGRISFLRFYTWN